MDNKNRSPDNNGSVDYPIDVDSSIIEGEKNGEDYAVSLDNKNRSPDNNGSVDSLHAEGTMDVDSLADNSRSTNDSVGNRPSEASDKNGDDYSVSKVDNSRSTNDSVGNRPSAASEKNGGDSGISLGGKVGLQMVVLEIVRVHPLRKMVMILLFLWLSRVGQLTRVSLQRIVLGLKFMYPLRKNVVDYGVSLGTLATLEISTGVGYEKNLVYSSVSLVDKSLSSVGTQICVVSEKNGGDSGISLGGKIRSPNGSVGNRPSAASEKNGDHSAVSKVDKSWSPNDSVGNSRSASSKKKGDHSDVEPRRSNRMRFS